jgi:hypothetical protein
MKIQIFPTRKALITTVIQTSLLILSVFSVFLGAALFLLIPFLIMGAAMGGPYSQKGNITPIDAYPLLAVILGVTSILCLAAFVIITIKRVWKL